ncbi:MAG: hypothetical protein ABSH41_27755 [Syntrophobacteraceae bacterium]|jgi:hypothetical protein
MTDREKNGPKAEEKVPARRRGQSAEKKESKRKGGSREEQASIKSIET